MDGETKYDGSKERGCNKSAKKYQDSTIIIFHSNAYIEPQTITKLPYKHEFVRKVKQKITFYGDYLWQDN